MNQRIKSTVTVTMQILTDSVWNDNTSMKQIIEQSKTDARQRIMKLFSDAGNMDSDLVVKRQGSNNVSLVSIDKITTFVESNR